ncbi:TPA: transcription termination/antitermination protein NusG [Candidatus Dependentiae bacterium]|nr:MAG: Transcription antitermination protein nusG [candidate division TM6 bacterium GW2011_GWF2_36_131]KKQ02871.1 MAG: Transcription antitermination protein nusG [candidate division TM6 bacterium GW2011_GWE2_36_25]KKQ19524.1 MAG: Transcription antitermination protein nusG [candidate division TM6 bacterium GW2011_GWA2_36_9]HBR70237.1 transcription termination/antitermination protein NusG [Candidatus Dependentiae bacterium]HCU00621.1 transcription termination/antitermination protein NusG [Candid
MKRWYVIQVYAGYEDQVKADLERWIKEKGLTDSFGDILIPSTQVKEIFSAQEAKDQRLFPGYILIEMEQNPETYQLVNSAPRVLKFLGGKEPMALSQKEIDRVIKTIKGEVVVKSETPEFAVGSQVDITGGPFAGFVGVIEEVDAENERLKIMVSIFGRMTPVELSFDQVKH